MKVRELIELIKDQPDAEIRVTVNYFGGDYGEHNCVMKGWVTDVSTSADIAYIYCDERYYP